MARSIGTLVLVLVLATPFSLPAQEARFGPPVPLGKGTIRTYVTVGPEGRPQELGVALSEWALEELPDLTHVPDGRAFLVLDLEMPAGNPTPFRFAMIDWNPRGHVPPFYQIPHFDFHFFLVDPVERDAVEGDPAVLEARGSLAPEAGFLPAHYFYPPGSTIPKMGSHWIDPASHELHGATFDRTFLYGTWDGRLFFYEPMITKAYIERRSDETIPIATPSRYAAPGWYPTAYRVRFDEEAKEYRIALTGFQESGKAPRQLSEEESESQRLVIEPSSAGE